MSGKALTIYTFSTKVVYSHLINEVNSAINGLFQNFCTDKYGPRTWPAKLPNLAPPDIIQLEIVKTFCRLSSVIYRKVDN